MDDILQDLPPHGTTMLVSDVRWPSLREAARIMLRNDSISISTPAEFSKIAFGLIDSISANDPARLTFPIISTGKSFIGFENEELVRLGGDQPSIDICWIPGIEEQLWLSLFSACEELLEAGYPGCLGCGGPDAEGIWDEESRRSQMLKSYE